MTWEILGRAATYPAVLGVLGVFGLGWLVRRADGVAARNPDSATTLANLGSAWAVALVLATLLRALCQSLTAWGAPDGLSWGSLSAVALESRWGGRWQWQPIAAAAILLGFLLARRLPRLGWATATASAIGFAAVLPMTGHAYSDPKSWIAQSVHVLGFGLWLGTLAVALVAPTERLGSSGETPTAIRRRWLKAFAPLAAGGAIAVLGSGVLLTLTAIPSWSSLFEAGYGRTLLIKLALVTAILALGARNYRALRQATSNGLGHAARLEATLALIVLLVSAVLTSLPQPDMAH